jgi:hypothetical protein
MTAKTQANLQAFLEQRGLAGMSAGEIDDVLDTISDPNTMGWLAATPFSATV